MKDEIELFAEPDAFLGVDFATTKVDAVGFCWADTDRYRVNVQYRIGFFPL